MRILVISDTHRYLANVYNVISDIYDKIDGIIHLGDVEDDVELIRHRFPDIPIYNVPGNCDHCFNIAEEDKVIVLNGKRIFLTHGHRYGVGGGVYRLFCRGRELGADCCLFGHTHVPYLSEEEGIIIMNPGSLTQPRGGSGYSYGMLIFDDDGLRASLVNYENRGLL